MVSCGSRSVCRLRGWSVCWLAGWFACPLVWVGLLGVRFPFFPLVSVSSLRLPFAPPFPSSSSLSSVVFPFCFFRSCLSVRPFFLFFVFLFPPAPPFAPPFVFLLSPPWFFCFSPFRFRGGANMVFSLWLDACKTIARKMAN